MELTESQREAITSSAKNILVNASAGSGKTSVFTARIINLIKKQDVSPQRILALTFSKDAAENMKKRIVKNIGIVGKEIPMYTFHSFAMRNLYKYFPSYYKTTQMMKSWWKLKLLSSIVGKKTAMNPDGMMMDIQAPTLATFISYQKANMILANMPVIIDENTPYVNEDSRVELQKAYEIFMDRQKKAKLIEFDDLLLHFYYRLKQSDTFRNEIKNKYDFVMVDEFQDTSHINLEILKMISEDNLFVVGDFRQSIYSFINADINNILEFTDNFPNTHVIELRENFRSTDEIVNLSNRVIEERDVPEYKQFSNAKSAIGVEGNKPTFTIYKTYADEVDGIIKKISNLVEDNLNDYRDFAILLRTNAQMGMFESKFAEMEIPLNVSSNHSFFERTEIDVLLSYLRIINNHEDNQSMTRIINTPNRYISNRLQSELDSYAYEQKISVFDALTRYKPLADKKQIGYLYQILTHFDNNLAFTNAAEILQYIIKYTKYYDHIDQTSKTETDRQMKKQSVGTLVGMAKKFDNIDRFLMHIEMIKDNNKESSDDAVNLMTVHSSKGLEFDHVFLPEVTSEYYPHAMSEGHEEEEARLLYVAISRAKYNLDLSYNTDGGASCKPSKFLTPIYPDLLQKQKEIYKGSELVTFTA